MNDLKNHAIRFILVGILNTAFSYTIYSLLLFAGLSYQISNLLALIMGILFSFKSQGILVFKNSNNNLIWRFILSWVVIYFCVTFLIGELIKYGLNAYIAGAATLPVSVGLSYISQNYFVFRKT